MIRITTLLLTGLLAPVAMLAAAPLEAGETMLLAAADDSLRAERRDAHRARQELRKARNQRLSDAVRSFRAEIADLDAQYQERARAVDTEFRLEAVRLQADTDARVATLETELQKRLHGSLQAGIGNDQDLARRIEAMERETRGHQDRLFEARRQGAAEVHAARVRAESRKDELYQERDQQALRRAAALGLAETPEPILATAIGGELTRQEQQWNQREEREVARLAERHAKLLAEYRNGARLRAWERANLDADFELEWQERAELHALQSQHSLFSAFLLQSDTAAGFDQKAYLDRQAENAEQQRLIKIRYEQARRENDIRRREQKRALAQTGG